MLLLKRWLLKTSCGRVSDNRVDDNSVDHNSVGRQLLRGWSSHQMRECRYNSDGYLDNRNNGTFGSESALSAA